MTSKRDIIEKMRELFPEDTALDFDNAGLLAGDINGDAGKVMIALDATGEAAARCVDEGCDLLITHHPLIFWPLYDLDCSKAAGRILCRLISAGVTYYAAHTNLDLNNEHSNKVLAETICGGNGTVYGVEGVKLGAGLTIPETSLADLADSVREKLDATGVIYYDDGGRKCRKIFVQGGSFDEDSIEVIRREGFDTVISGEIKHNYMLELSEYGISGIIAGHRETERVFMPHLAEVLKESFPDTEFLVII